MSEEHRSRREFLKRMGFLTGGAALGPGAFHPDALGAALSRGADGTTGGVSTPDEMIPSSSPPSPFPELNDRACGWLRFLWEKATTEDDWSRWGVPHPWWDRYSIPGVTSYARFDLQYSTYAVLLMADQTPAWREVYTRIADELASRYPTYWGAVDWLTQIGDDPARGDYPPRFRAGIPEDLVGDYNRIGWTANGVEPWGLQPDPIGADGFLFYRGWFGLMLSIYRYVSGDDKWEQPFPVTGYDDQDFEWDHHRMVERMSDDYRERPEGPHCENTKIWPYCNSAAALGLYLYDRLHGTDRHLSAESWIEYLSDNYMGVSDGGELEWFTTWYDPLADHKANGGPASGLNAAFLLLPQAPELAQMIYDAAANAQGWRAGAGPVRPSSNGLLLARELGDDAAVARLAAAAERAFEPRFFGDQDEYFGWWFNYDEGFPRGQQSALMMVSEVGEGGDWLRAFEAPHMDKFDAPTVEGVDFPRLGVRQAWNDPESGILFVRTYPTAPRHRGRETAWRVTNLPSSEDVGVFCDGEVFEAFEVEGPGTIRIDTDTDGHEYQIFTGYRGDAAATNEARRRRRRDPGAGAAGAAGAATGGVAFARRESGTGDRARRRASSDLLPGGGGCPCCAAGG